MPAILEDPSLLSHYVASSVVSRNLRLFDRECEKIRIGEEEQPEAPKIAALAAFHAKVIRATGMDSAEIRNDREAVLKRICPEAFEVLDENKTAEVLEEMNFVREDKNLERPSVRQTGRITLLSRFLEPSRLPQPEGPKTLFSTYSKKSAW